MNDSTKAVFLSYTSQDAEAARCICEALRNAGIEVWLDQSELRGGDAWDAAIRKQIRVCALFMPVISANTNVRVEGYFRLEWKLAVDRSHLMAAEKAFLLPVVVDATREAEALVPDKFREVQWTYLPAGETTAAFTGRVARLLSPGDRHSAAAPAPAPGSIPAAPAPRRRVPGRRGLAGAAILVAVMAVAAVMAYKAVYRGTSIGMVAVLPFQNATGDPANEYLSDGISESLINKLSGLNGLHVISRTSAFAFKDRKMEPIEIGRKLGADALILGSLTLRGSSLNVTAELVSVRDATQLWGEKYARRMDDVLQVEGEIATTIVQTLHQQLSGDEKGRLAHSETTDPEAYRLYLKGREYLVGTQQEMDKSVDYFQQAVARAPDYAMAHAGLAEVYGRQAFLRAIDPAEAVGKARAAVTRALELDPNLAEAHTALGDIRWYFEWDWAAAEAEYRRALALNPGSSDAHESYGAFLNALDRLDEGLGHSREAARLDPLSVGPFHDIAINALIRGDYDLAAAGFRHTIDIDPNWTWGYIKLARTLSLQKKCKEAFAQTEIAERKIAGGVTPLSWSWLGATYATCGDTVRAHQKLDALHALEKKQYVDPVTFALIHGALGEVDQELQYYEKGYQDRSTNMAYALIEPLFNRELAGNARYQAIIDRMGIPRPAR
ncbi:MAG: TIR domain-containing protein [Steroidobacterales bacterium]